MGIRIRHYRDGDFARGLLVCLNALSPTPNITEGRFSQAKEIHSSRKHYGFRTYVAVNDNKEVVGTASLLLERKFLRGGKYVAHIEDVAVHPDHQGLGIGTALVEYCIAEAKRYNTYKVILDCTPKLAEFYTKMGFRNSGVQMRLDI